MGGRGADRIRKSWRGLVPIGVAAAVALAIGGGVDFAHSYGEARKKGRSAKPAAERAPSAPRHLIGIRGSGEALVVRDVRTGRDVGLPVAAPRAQRFQRVAPAGDGVYVVAVASVPSRQVTFQRLRVDGAGRPQKLVPLPRATLSGASAPWSDLAVAPDGDTIAYVTYRAGARARLDVVSAQTGRRKVWTSRTPGRVGSLSWAGSTLSFVWSPLGPAGSNGSARRPVHQVRTLSTSTTAPGDLRVSKPTLKLPPGSTGAAMTSRDGRTVLAALARNGQLTIRTYTLPTGRPARVLWTRQAPGRLSRLDADHTGDHLLISAANGVLFAENAQPVPAKDLLDAAW